MPNNLFTFPPQKTAKIQVPDDEPIYRVVGKGFWDGATLHPEYNELGQPTLIAYDGVPNFGLLPMNDKALTKVEEWVEELKEGAELCKKDPNYGGLGGYRTGVMTQELDVRNYMKRVLDSGRFDPKRVEPAIMSNKVNKATARVIEQIVVDTPEIKSVSANKKRDQTSQLNG